MSIEDSMLMRVMRYTEIIILDINVILEINETSMFYDKSNTWVIDNPKAEEYDPSCKI